MDKEIVLSVNKVSKSYWTGFSRSSLLRVVDDLSLSLQRGEAYGLIGPNGAGKTTTVKMIVGLAAVDSGSIKILGQGNSLLAVKNKVGYMPENPSFYSHLSAREFLYFIGQLFALPPALLKSRTEEILQSVGLSEAIDRHASRFSKGMRQRLGLAQALINDPEILILDEPLDGLDPLGRSDIKDYLIRMKEAGKTILISSHILSDIEAICDRIGIIDRGRLIKEGKIAQLIPRGGSLEKLFVETIKSVQ